MRRSRAGETETEGAGSAKPLQLKGLGHSRDRNSQLGAEERGGQWPPREGPGDIVRIWVLFWVKGDSE